MTTTITATDADEFRVRMITDAICNSQRSMATPARRKSDGFDGLPG